MDWKKIRQAVRTVLAAVLICAASVGITGDPAYAADMGAVYGIYEHGTMVTAKQRVLEPEAM